MKKIAQKGILLLLGMPVLLLISILGAGVFITLPDQEMTPSGYSRNISKYLPMRDGVKIAVDVWFPANMQTGVSYPTALTMTRYWRAQHRTLLGRGLIALDMGLGDVSDILDLKTQWFNEAGYVVVQVDARGTGASFGSRRVEWDPDEIEDYGEILKWIGEQPWSNGKVGSYGISYAGNTAEMIMTTGRPELKVVAPLYGDFNPFLGLIQPGGAQNAYLDDWGHATHLMDRNDLCGLVSAGPIKCWLLNTLTTGVKPVEGFEDLLPGAVQDHRDNMSMVGSNSHMEYLDDTYGTSGYSTEDIAPFGHQKSIEASDVPMIIHLGWTDAATVEGALSRYLTFSNDQHVLIGPFTHGGKMDTDPFAAVDRPVSPSLKKQYNSLIQYFDMFLKEPQGKLSPSKQITYYILGANEWKTTESWPPVGVENKPFYFAAKQGLSENMGLSHSVNKYTVNFMASSGKRTRWHTNFGGGDVVYADRAEQAEKLLSYTSDPVKEPLEITGTPNVSLYVSSSHTDNMFLAYLEDISPDGEVKYITEGMFRADNRALGHLPYVVDGVAHSYLRSDARPMVPDQTVEISFNLQPVSVQIKPGHRIRVSLAGADEGMFKRWPREGSPEWTIHTGHKTPSHIVLPILQN